MVCGMAVDVTELGQQRAEVARLNDQLARQVKDLRTILDTIPVGVMVAHDPQCKHITVNRVLAEMLGTTAGENISSSREGIEEELPFKLLKEGVELGLLELPMQRTGARGTDIDGEVLQILRDDGRRITVMENIRPSRDDSGVVVGVVGSCVDITVRSAEEALREADRRKDEFLAMLAHELRNPLAPIPTPSQLLRLPDDGATPRVGQRGHRAPGAGTSPAWSTTCSTSPASPGARSSCKTRALDARRRSSPAPSRPCGPLVEEREHELTCRCRRGPLWLEADPVRLEQVIVNLLTNAAKYTDRRRADLADGAARGGDVGHPVARHRHRHPARDAAPDVRAVRPGGPHRSTAPGRAWASGSRWSSAGRDARRQRRRPRARGRAGAASSSSAPAGGAGRQGGAGSRGSRGRRRGGDGGY